MEWIIPGTVLTGNVEDAVHVEAQFQSMFLAGGIVLSQVSGITGLESYTVQNWVKRGFLTPPDHKRYSLRQLCRIININMLKNVLPMERIVGLMSYINGDLDDESDDMIDDAALYFMFVRLAAQSRVMNNPPGTGSRRQYAGGEGASHHAHRMGIGSASSDGGADAGKFGLIFLKGANKNG